MDLSLVDFYALPITERGVDRELYDKLKANRKRPTVTGRSRGGVIGCLTENERRGYSDGYELTNMQWSRMHGLWLEALRAGVPICMSDAEMTIQFKYEFVHPNLPRISSNPDFCDVLREYNPIRIIRLRVESADGRMMLAVRIEPYLNHKKTVQAMFLALQSILVRIPSRSRLAHA